MLTPAVTTPAPTSEQIRLAWTLTFAPAAAAATGPSEEHARQLGTLLDGLVLIAAAGVRDADGVSLTVAEVVARAAATEAATGWHAEFVAAGATARRPFLLELARRALALGQRTAIYMDDDPVLDPQRSPIDPACANPALAFARAVTAIELQCAEILAVVVARHLQWRADAEGAGWQESARAWLGPLLEDPSVPCLLVAALAGAEGRERKGLWRQLVALYEHSREENEPAMTWLAGPLAACAALGRWLRRPAEAARAGEFAQHVAKWSGWQDEEAWPTRHPGADLHDLQARLTEQAATALGVAECKLWPRGALGPALIECWPSLQSFCFFRTPRVAADGGSIAPRTAEAHDEPHA